MVLKQMMDEHMNANDLPNPLPSLDGMMDRILLGRYGSLYLRNRMRKHPLYVGDCLELAILLLGLGQRKECLANQQ